METPYTLPSDGAAVFLSNSGAPIRSYVAVNGTDVPLVIADPLGIPQPEISPGRQGVGAGNWPSLTARLLSASSYGLATVTVSDADASPVSGFMPPVGSVAIAGIVGGPSVISGQVTVDSGKQLAPVGASFRLSYLSIFAVPELNADVAMDAVWLLSHAANNLMSYTAPSTIAFGQLSVGQGATGSGGRGTGALVIPPEQGGPTIVVPATGTVRLQITRYDPSTWAVDAVAAGFHAIFVPVSA